MPVRSALACALLLLAAACGLADDPRDERNKTQYLTFADPAFERYLVGHFDQNGDGRISRYEAERVRRMDCQGAGIASLDGIEAFARLERLNCADNLLKELEVEALARLEWLDCSGNRIASLRIEGLRSLTTLYCPRNLLAETSFGGCASLATLDGRRNAFTLLDVRPCAPGLRADLRENPDLGTVYALPTQQIEAEGAEIIR